jgi:methionyl-tRNA formyltransferase
MAVRLALLGAPGAPITREARRYLSGRVELVVDSDERVSLATLRDARPDVILSAAHHYVIGPKMRAAARLGAVGLHPSLLPAYRGSYPLWWALRAGEKEVGLSLYHLTDDMDAGAVISQYRVPVGRLGFAALYERVAALVPTALSELLSDIERTGSIPPGSPQEGEHRVYPTPPSPMRAIMKARWMVSGRR